MKNKFYFFLIFLLGLLFVFIGILAFSFSSYFMYMIVVFLGLFILVDALFCLVSLFQGNTHDPNWIINDSIRCFGKILKYLLST